ncbi:KPN_02809 family neutral zinc metallopeptidase [Bartonella sp. LJL80]
MRWEGRRQSKNVEDRRGQRASGGSAMRTGLRGIGLGLLTRGGGRGILILIVIFVGLSFFGFNPSRFLFGDGALERNGSSQTSQQSLPPQADDKRGQFIATVLAETEDTWTTIFKQHNAVYQPPVLVRFSGTVRSACGLATAAVGPFYCPADRKLYLDDSFFEQLSRQFGAPGEFAQAYVIAHEVGHHIQNLTGVLNATNRQRARMSTAAANALSVKVELQADCYAGVWAHSTDQKGLLDSGDIEAALNAAHKIGDDALQKQAQGYVVPDSFTHGSSVQRAEWFNRGYQSGKMESCDTFSANL